MPEESNGVSELSRTIMTSAERLHASLNGISDLFASAEPQARELERARHDIKKTVEGLIDDRDVDDFMREWIFAFREEVDAEGSEEVRDFLSSEEPKATDEMQASSEDASIDDSSELSSNVGNGKTGKASSAEIAPSDLSSEALYELVEFGMAALRSRRVLDFVAQQGVQTEYLSRVNHRLLQPHDSFVLANSIVVMAVSSFESHIASLLHAFFNEHRGAAATIESEDASEARRYSLKEFLSFDSIDELIDDAIDDRIDQFMRQNFAIWADWWKQKLDGNWELFAVDWEAAIEVIQRRHVIMHNGARASRQYIRNVPERFKDVEVGARLAISEDYVRMAIDNLLSIGLLAAYNLWIKLAKDRTEDVASVMLSKSYELLVSEQYGAARAVAVAGTSLRCPEQIRLSLWINSLIARKQMEGVSSIAQELGKWDDSAASTVLRVAKAALLDDFDALAELLPEAIDSGYPKWTEVKRWPLLRSFREQPLYVEMLQRYEGDTAERDSKPGEVNGHQGDGDG
jgi:hypothetical protein